MTAVPANPKIYHITHIDNLAAIIASNKLVSDAIRIEKDIDCSQVGMSTIKQRRLQRLEVSVHPGKKVCEFVPFYFCPRSVMLYILHKGNHADITYQGGQAPIIHLQADLNAVIQRVEAKPHPWAFSDGNAGAFMTRFYNRPEDLDKVDWNAVNNQDFTDHQVKDSKQAEFLTYQVFPWTLIQKIGTINNTVATQVKSILAGHQHQPTIKVERGWYY